MSLNFTSIYGRWLGVTYGSSAGTGGGQNKYLSGDVQGLKMKNLWFGTPTAEVPEYGPDALQTLTSGTTATAVTVSGVTVFNYTSSNALTWNMGAPTQATARKYLVYGTSLAGTVTVKLSAGNYNSTAGTTVTSLVLQNPGVTVCLVAQSTSLWSIISPNSSGILSVS